MLVFPFAIRLKLSRGSFRKAHIKVCPVISYITFPSLRSGEKAQECLSGSSLQMDTNHRADGIELHDPMNGLR